jgi:hypothetical protein
MEIGGGFNASRRLGAPLSQSEYWVSFQLQEGSPNDQVWLGLDVVPTSTPLIWFGRRLDQYFIAMGGSIVTTCCVGSPLGVTDLMVARFRQVSPLLTEIAVWLNTDNFALPPDMLALMPTVPFLELNMQVQPGLFADEVRIGTTAADVAAVGNVPEPGSLALLATGILGGIGVLRRKLF